MAPSNQWTHQTSSVISHSSATVRVKNLQSTINGPQDAWGRHGRPQPILLSATVTFEKPFNTTSSGDVLSFDTLHYGFLSKAILAALDKCSANEGIKTLDDVLDYLWRDLTHISLKSLQFDQLDKTSNVAALVSRFRAAGVQITACLPKASLAGDGLSMTATTVFDTVEGETLLPRASRSVKIHDVRIPILIGVNPNEREAKQAVIANVDIDGFTSDSELWTVEKVIVEDLTASSFETLEALAMKLMRTIANHLRGSFEPLLGKAAGWEVCITLEKPIAVPMADASCVELRMNTNDVPQ